MCSPVNVVLSVLRGIIGGLITGQTYTGRNILIFSFGYFSFIAFSFGALACSLWGIIFGLLGLIPLCLLSRMACGGFFVLCRLPIGFFSLAKIASPASPYTSAYCPAWHAEDSSYCADCQSAFPCPVTRAPCPLVNDFDRQFDIVRLLVGV